MYAKLSVFIRLRLFFLVYVYFYIYFICYAIIFRLMKLHLFWKKQYQRTKTRLCWTQHLVCIITSRIEQQNQAKITIIRKVSVT